MERGFCVGDPAGYEQLRRLLHVWSLAVVASDSSGKPSNPYCGVLLGSLLDAGLYLGQPGDLTASWPNPAI